MEPIDKKAERFADRLLDRARDEIDIDTAALLRKLGRCYVVAEEVVRSKTHERRQAAYLELVDLVKGKDGE